MTHNPPRVGLEETESQRTYDGLPHTGKTSIRETFRLNKVPLSFRHHVVTQSCETLTASDARLPRGTLWFG